MLLHRARERVQMPGARVPRERGPRGIRRARGSHRRVDVRRASLRHSPYRHARRRIDGFEAFSGERLYPLATDVVAKDAAVLREPRARRRVALGRGAKVH